MILCLEQIQGTGCPDNMSQLAHCLHDQSFTNLLCQMPNFFTFKIFYINFYQVNFKNLTAPKTFNIHCAVNQV